MKQFFIPDRFNKYLLITQEQHNGISQILYQDQDFLVEALKQKNLEHRRLYFRRDVAFIQCEVTAFNGKVDYEESNKSYLALFEEAIKGFLNQNKLKSAKMCILGNGCGVMQMHLQEHFGKRITHSVGVEIESRVIDLGKKFFFYEESPSLKVVCQKAEDFLLENKGAGFDIVIYDISTDSHHPEGFRSQNFFDNLHKMMSKTSVYLCNTTLTGEELEEMKTFA